MRAGCLSIIEILLYTCRSAVVTFISFVDGQLQQIE